MSGKTQRSEDSSTWGRWWLWEGMRGRRWSGSAVHRSSGFYWGTPEEGKQVCDYKSSNRTTFVWSVHQRPLTVFPVKVTGGDCQEMLKLELLVGVKLVEAEPAELLLLDGMDTGAVAWGWRSKVRAQLFLFKAFFHSQSPDFQVTFCLFKAWVADFSTWIFKTKCVISNFGEVEKKTWSSASTVVWIPFILRKNNSSFEHEDVSQVSLQ